MPIIPTYTAHEELDPDQRGVPIARVSTASAQAGVQAGRAIEALGSQLSQSGAGLQRGLSKFMPSFDAAVSPDPLDHQQGGTTPNAAAPAPVPPTRSLASEGSAGGETPATPATSSANVLSPTASTPAPQPTIPVPAATVEGRAQQQQDQALAFATGLQDDERRQAIQGAFDAAVKTAPVNGTNLYASFMRTADEMATDAYKSMPDGPAKIAALEQWKTERPQWAAKAAAMQWQMTGDSSRDQIARIGQNSVQEVKQNPDALDGVLATGQQRIADAPGLRPDERAQATQQFSRSVLMAGLAAKYPTDPDGMRRALSLDAQNAPLDRTAYAAWLRGLPRDQFDTLMASAQAARDKDPSVSVDHRLQDAYRAALAQQPATPQASAMIPGGIAATPAPAIGSDRATEARNPAFSNAIASGRSGQAMAYFTAQGWSQAQAAGIVGNLVHESGGLNTAARNAGDGTDGSDSIGIGQWNGQRARNLAAFAAARGTSPTDFGTQLAFVQHELTGSERRAGAALQRADNVHDATAAVTLRYERPAGSQGGVAENASGWNNRLRNATALAGGQYPAAGATGSPNARYSALSQQDVQQLIAGAEAGRQQAAAQAEQQRQVDIRATAQAVDDDVAAAQATGKSDPNLDLGHVTAVLGPEAAQQYRDRLGTAFDVYRATAGMPSMSNDDLAASAEAFHPGDDESAPDYGRRAAVYFGVHDRAQKILEDRAADPAGAVVHDVGVMAASADASRDPAAYERLAQARLTAQSALGIPPEAQSPITLAEAKAYAAHMQPAPGQDAASAADRVVQDINARFGRYAVPALAQVMFQRTGQRDVSDVLSAALQRARSAGTGPLVTTAEGARVAMGRQAQAIETVTGAAAPAFDNPMGDFGGGGAAPAANPYLGAAPGIGRSTAPAGAGLKTFGEAVDALAKDPDRLMPFFIQRYGVGRVPAGLRDRVPGAAAR